VERREDKKEKRKNKGCKEKKMQKRGDDEEKESFGLQKRLPVTELV
jgi:hypothetical protein